MFVKPRIGINVRDPESLRHLPQSGCDVPTSTYWVRRLQDGDVQLCAPPPDVVRVEPIPDSKQHESADGEENAQ